MSEETVKKATKSEGAKSTAPKSAEKPIVAKKANNSQQVRFVIISHGQGGARIGQMLKSMLPNNPYMIAVNTSNEDFKQIDLPDEQKFKIGGVNTDGAGKNRNKAIAYFKKFSTVNVYNEAQLDAITTFIGYYEEVLFNPSYQTIIINVFSSDGGTGSGLGPMFTASLANYVNAAKTFTYNNKVYEIDDVTNEIPRPVVVGLVPRCRITEGASNLQNNIECFMDCQKIVDNGLCNIFIADNNLPEDVKYANTDEMYNIINARIVAPWVKFFGVEMNSDIKCMDLQDKINVLRIPGCSSFSTVTKVNQFNYAIPRGQSVARTVHMLRHDVDDLGAEEAAAKNVVAGYDIMSLDTTPVFFDLKDSGISVDSVSKDLVGASMVGFFGFKSLNAIVEDLRDNLRRAKVATEKKHNVIQEHSTGFSTARADAAELENTFGAKTVDHNSLMDLF